MKLSDVVRMARELREWENATRKPEGNFIRWVDERKAARIALEAHSAARIANLTDALRWALKRVRLTDPGLDREDFDAALEKAKWVLDDAEIVDV